MRSIFPSPAGARKSTSNEQNVSEYYMLNHRIRDLLFHYTKRCYFASILFGKSVSKKNASSVLQGACERCKRHRKPAKCPLFDCINEMTRDKR